MLWIECPNCGSRPVEEYRFGGELPGVPDWVTDADQRDVDYTWFFDNIDGPSTERWYHHAGCRRWLTLHRNTHDDVVITDPREH